MTDQIVRSAVANFAGGRFKRIAGTDVAANTEFSETVPAGKAWGLLAVHVVLVQGATQTPQPILVLDDGTTDFFRGFGSSAAQAAAACGPRDASWEGELSRPRHRLGGYSLNRPDILFSFEGLRREAAEESVPADRRDLEEADVLVDDHAPRGDP